MLHLEYQNADLWGLLGGANAPRAPTPPPPATGLFQKQSFENIFNTCLNVGHFLTTRQFAFLFI